MEPKCFHNGKMSAGISPSDVIHLCEGTKKLQFLPLPTPRMSEIMTETCRRRNSLSVSRKCSILSKSLRQNKQITTISRLFLPPVWCDTFMGMCEKKSKSQLRYKKSLYICSAKNLNVFGWNDVGSVPTSVTDRLFWGYNAAQRCILFFCLYGEKGRRTAYWCLQDSGNGHK